MVDFMLEGDGQQSGCLAFYRLSLQVQIANLDMRVTFDSGVITRYREAALFFEAFSLSFDDFRVDRHDQLRVFFGGAIHHNKFLVDANLRCGQAHSRCSIHGLSHIRRQGFDFLGDGKDRFGFIFQDRIGIVSYG